MLLKILSLKLIILMLSLSQLNSINDFDFKKASPSEFLDYLCDNPDMNFLMIDPDEIPPNWLTLDEMEKLMSRIESNRITTPVYSAYASIDFKPKPRTSEGVEASFMIDCFRKNKRYPSDLNSQSYGIPLNGYYQPNPTLVSEVKVWYEKFKNDSMSFHVKFFEDSTDAIFAPITIFENGHQVKDKFADLEGKVTLSNKNNIEGVIVRYAACYPVYKTISEIEADNIIYLKTSEIMRRSGGMGIDTVLLNINDSLELKIEKWNKLIKKSK